MTVRPFRLWGDSAKAELCCVLREPLAAWGEAWLSRQTLSTVVVVQDAPLPDDEGMAHAGSGGHWVAIRRLEADWRPAAAAVFGGEDGLGGAQPSPVIRSMLLDGGRDLIERLAHAAGVTAAVDGDKALDCQPDRGTLGVEARFGALCLTFAIGGDAVAALTAKRVRPASAQVRIDRREAGIVTGQVTLEAWVGGAELTVGELAGLEAGDVIRLDSLPTAPLSLRTRSGAVVAQGHLGLKDGHKALQLSPQNIQNTQDRSSHA
jgi:hypothetical protein